MTSRFPLLFITICLATACSSTKQTLVEQLPNPPKLAAESTPVKMAGADMRVQNRKAFVKSHSGRELPRPQGDLIAENFDGSKGYIYYNAATYSWYDPKKFKGESQTGAFHGRSSVRGPLQPRAKN